VNFIPPPPTRIPFTEQEGLPIEWSNWMAKVEEILNHTQATGATANRPAVAPYVGYPFFDTTLGKPIWAKTITATSTAWVLADGTAA